MVHDEPKVNKEGRYSVDETCAALGISRSTLRRHTNKGVIRCGIRRSNTRKFYTGSEIVRYWKSQL